MPLTVDALIGEFRSWAGSYYRSPEGEPTGEIHAIRDALRPLARLFGRLRADQFGPRKLVAVREAMINADLSRGLINRRVNVVKRLFRWAAERELVPASVHHGLRAVSGLRPGRSAAREAPPVLPVAEEAVSAVLPHVPPPVRAMIELQLLTGMRPGEAVILRPRDVDRSRATWIYEPSRHKTRHLGHARRIPLGPRAQAVLAPFLAGRPVDAFAFSPREASAWRLVRAGARAAPRFDYERAPRERYDVDSYRRAIARGARRAGVCQVTRSLTQLGIADSYAPPWSIPSVRWLTSVPGGRAVPCRAVDPPGWGMPHPGARPSSISWRLPARAVGSSAP